MITIRPATIDDLPTLVPLFDAYRVFYEQSSDRKLAKDFLQDRFRNNESVIYIATEEDIAVGFTQLYKTFSSVSAQHSWILNDLYVDKVHRKKGIGEQLLKKAQQFAKDNQAKGLALETSNDNPAQHLYERLGWKKDVDYLHYFWKAD